MKAVGDDRATLSPNNLPAWLTALQAVAWVVTRDVRVFAWVGSDRRFPNCREAEIRLPSGATKKVEIPKCPL